MLLYGVTIARENVVTVIVLSDRTSLGIKA